MPDTTSPTPALASRGSRRLRDRVVAELVVPGVVWMLVWSSGGFPISGAALVNAAWLWAILYIPAKTAKVLIHRETGRLRRHEWAQSLVLLAFVALAIGGGVGIVIVSAHEYGLVGLLGSPAPVVLWIYFLTLIWGAVSGTG